METLINFCEKRTTTKYPLLSFKLKDQNKLNIFLEGCNDEHHYPVIVNCYYNKQPITLSVIVPFWWDSGTVDIDLKEIEVI